MLYGAHAPCPCWLWYGRASDEPSRQRHDTQDRCDEEELPDLNANIEKQQCHRNRCLGQADFAFNAPAKPNPCSRPKVKRDDPRPPLCPTLPALPCMNNFAGDKHDAQSDTGLDRLSAAHARTPVSRPQA